MPAARRVGAQRRGIDGAEHRSILRCVMADKGDSSGKTTSDLCAQKRALSIFNHHASRNVNDPIRAGSGATPRARHRGRSRHGLLSALTASALAGGTNRRPADGVNARKLLRASQLPPFAPIARQGGKLRRQSGAHEKGGTTRDPLDLSPLVASFSTDFYTAGWSPPTVARRSSALLGRRLFSW